MVGRPNVLRRPLAIGLVVLLSAAPASAEIARIKTIMRERELKAQKAPAASPGK